MTSPAAANLALLCLGTLAEQLAVPGSPLQRQMLAGLEQDSGLHPASLLRLTQLFAKGYSSRHLAMAQRRAGAVGPWQPLGTVAVVAPGNLPVAAWQAAIEPLLAGNAVRVRPSRGHQRALINLQGALAAIEPRVARQLSVLEFDRDDRRGWQMLLNQARCLAIHGSDAAVQAVLGHAAAAGWAGRLRVQGEMRSLAVIDAAHWQRGGQRLLDQLADDALLADGRGCMSLRTVVAVGLAPDHAMELHRQLHEALGRAAVRWPAGPADATAGLQRQLSAQALEMQELLADGALTLSQRADGWLATAAHPSWLGDSWPGPGGRDLVLWTAPDWPQVQLRLQPWRGRISTLAAAADSEQVQRLQQELAIPRLCRPGQMQAPSADRSADGHAPLEGMVRYLDRLR